ncbi:unnamed protein product [Caenorhabditis brenneri]
MERLESYRVNEQMELVTLIGKFQLIQIWEQNFLSAAYWFQQFPEFKELPMDVKLEILKSVWMIWLRLEKLSETAEYQRKQVLGSDLFKFAEGSCMDIKESEVDLSWLSKYSFGQMKSFLLPNVDKFWKFPLQLMMNLNPSNTELNFMLIQLCLSDAQKRASLETRTVIEHILAEPKLFGPKTMPSAIYITGPCKICEQPAHGNHFGVVSCRACAAFFRRAGAKNAKSQDIICQRGNCRIFEDGQYRCKACRLKKCLDAGMDSSKFHTGRDLLSVSHTSQKPLGPQSLANFLGRPEFILCFEPDKISTEKITIDCSYLINKAIQVFHEETVSTTPYNFDNSLDQLTFAMERVKSERANQELTIVASIEKNRLFYYWEQNFLGVAKWFRQFPEFMNLSMDVKIDILKHTWMMFGRLTNLVETANYQRREVLGSNVFKISDGSCMDIEESEVDVSWCTNYSFKQLNALLLPDMNKFWRIPLELMLKLNPTNTELNFMLIQLCLSDALKRASPGSREVIENILAAQANNLHDYYNRKMKNPNYSGRLTKMMKIVQLLEGDARFQREKIQLARVFDLFSVEYTHPEMFEIL